MYNFLSVGTFAKQKCVRHFSAARATLQDFELALEQLVSVFVLQFLCILVSESE